MAQMRGQAKGTAQSPKKPDLVSVERIEDIPAFANEEEEHRFWGTHRFGDALLAQMEPVPPEGDDWLPPARARSKPVQIRFTADTIRRAKALAAERNTGYQTLIKEFVTERLYEEEKRTGSRSTGHIQSTRSESVPS